MHLNFWIKNDRLRDMRNKKKPSKMDGFFYDLRFFNIPYFALKFLGLDL